MKPSVRASLALGFLLGAAIASAQPKAAEVSIFGINDFHGHIQPTAPTPALVRALIDGQPARRAGGMAHLAGLLDELRAKRPASLTVGAGDMIGASPADSSLLGDQPAIEALNRLGVSASSLGNHEFDRGPQDLAHLIAGRCGASGCALGGYSGAKFEYLAANVRTADGSALPGVKTFVLREVGGWRIALVGAVTRNTPSFLRPVFTQGLVFEDEVAAIERVLPQVRAAKPDAIVVLMHEGATVARAANITGPAPAFIPEDCANLSGRAVDIAAKLPADVRVFFTAHTHQTYACELGGKYLVQGGANGAQIAEVRFAPDAQGRLQPVAQALHMSAHDSVIPSASAAAFVAQVQQQTQGIKSQPLGRINSALSRTPIAGHGDAPVGRWIADAQLLWANTHAGGADLAFMNASGIRGGLGDAGTNPAKPHTVSRAEAMSMLPFGNELVLLQMSGAQLVELLLSQASPRQRFLQPSSNLRYRWVAAAEPTARVQQLLLNGKPVAPDAQLRVVVNSFLADGGEQFAIFKRLTQRQTIGQDLEAAVHALGKTSGVADTSSYGQGRIELTQP